MNFMSQFKINESTSSFHSEIVVVVVTVFFSIIWVRLDNLFDRMSFLFKIFLYIWPMFLKCRMSLFNPLPSTYPYFLSLLLIFALNVLSIVLVWWTRHHVLVLRIKLTLLRGRGGSLIGFYQRYPIPRTN